MGEVYRADDLKLGQSVALKFLSHGDVARLVEEVRIGRQITHPNVCRLYDIAEIDGQLFLTMEFIDGEDLASLLRRIGRLPPEKALTLTRDICAGLAAAHEGGVIHRDLKPANVMIDGRGRARITDFGLAVPGERGASDSAGTPAYMAPEQLLGESASVRSDLYALGLVLYEIFTGRRAFQADSKPELLLREQRGDFTRPSQISREIPAAVERTIVRCLEADPAARPASVDEAIRELPGGDPLAAAVAAGETPSPAMVAAASRAGDLTALVAWSMCALAVAGLIATAALSGRTLLHDASDMKAPEILRERARQILADAGLKERPRDSDLFVEAGPTIVYRQSRWAMRPLNPSGTLRIFDPPLDVAKGGNARNPMMANVELDSAGRLLRFFIVPPTMEKGVAADPDWTPFLIAAGYDPRLLTATEPEWSARVDSDRRSAWLTRDGRRIEAAAYHGRPVAFEIITKDFVRYATSPPSLPTFLPERLATVMFIIFMIAIPIAGLALARSNLRSRRGDRAGAFRAAMFFLAVMLIGLVFQAHHSMRFVDEWMIVSWLVVQATFWALMTGLIYIALEPFVRRRWPQILISWTRLLSGRFADPMVGRDVLMGAAGAAVAMFIWQATLLIAAATSFPTPVSLGPPRFVVAMVAGALAEAVLRGVGLVILLVVLRAVFRNDVAASLLTTLLIATMTLGDTFGPLWLRALYAVNASLLGVLLARNFGVLAVMSYAFFILVQRRLPLTFDTDAWYFGRSAMVMLLLLAVILYAFRTSLGSKRWFPRLAFD